MVKYVKAEFINDGSARAFHGQAFRGATSGGICIVAIWYLYTYGTPPRRYSGDFY